MLRHPLGGRYKVNMSETLFFKIIRMLVIFLICTVVKQKILIVYWELGIAGFETRPHPPMYQV